MPFPRNTVLALALLAAMPVWGQAIDARVFHSHDSDDFDEWVVRTGYSAANGWGLRAGAMHYRSPQWSATGRSMAATYRQAEGGRSVDAALGAASVEGHTRLVGLLDVLVPVARGASAGLSIERDLLNSPLGLRTGMTFTNLAVVGDYAFTPRFNVGVAAGATLFSDDNTRPYLRTRWNVELHADTGLNAYVRTRSYRNSDPRQPAYFSPPRLHEAAVGLSSRMAIGTKLVVSAQVDGGQERTPGNIQPIWSWSVGIGSHRSQAVAWGVSLLSTNSANVLSGSASYRYTQVVAHVRVPL